MAHVRGHAFRGPGHWPQLLVWRRASHCCGTNEGLWLVRCRDGGLHRLNHGLRQNGNCAQRRDHGPHRITVLPGGCYGAISELNHVPGRQLAIGIVELHQTRVPQRLDGGDAFPRIKAQTHLDEVQGVDLGGGQHLRERSGWRPPPHVGQALQHPLDERGPQSLQIITRREAQEVHDHVELAHRRSAREHWPSFVELSEHTARAPNVETLCVAAHLQQAFRGAVPTRRNVIGQLRKRRVCAAVLREDPGHAEVTEPHVATRIDEEVLRFYVAVEHARGVQIL
mmetsp:Transcript_89554/g.252365  ORF Transcript_89554/g.252365 Transcript_89554/m.252365 type:complete len:282 (+) Transcript_89554:965-1810(+)